MSPRKNSQGESDGAREKSANMARVLLDDMDFVLLSVRNQTESLFPQTLSMLFASNLRLLRLALRLWKELIQ
jgi:hypothetical protein